MDDLRWKAAADRDENGNTPEDVVAIIEGASKDFLYWYEQAAFALEQYGEALDSLVGVIEGNEYISTRLKAQAQQMIKELASDAKLRQFRETVRKSLDQEAQKRRKAR